MPKIPPMEFELTHQLATEGISDPAVLAAVMRVDRTAFVPEAYRSLAHADEPLPIGYGQTLSQPFIVAAMTSALCVQPGERVLEVGTGSGYQAAVLAELGCEVFSIERLKELSEQAALTLVSQDYRVHLRVGDGSLGWPEEAPFHGILVTAADSEVPRALVNQLVEGRRMIMPLGDADAQRLSIVIRHGNRYSIRPLLDVCFVPLITG